MKLAAICALLAFMLGSCMGSGLNDSPPPEFIEVPRTKIIREPAPPPEQVEVFPESCQEAVALTADIVRSAEKVYSSGEEQIRILADARLYLAAQRNTESIDERQRRLHGKTVGDLFDLEKQFALYDAAIQECKNEQ